MRGAEYRKRITEGEFQETVIGLAKIHGWRVSHFRPAWTEQGWRTPLSGHTGFPDLALARSSRVILAELKTQRGKVTQDQQAWADAIGPEMYRLWRPSDLEQIKEELK